MLIHKFKIPDFFEKKMFEKVYNHIRLSNHAFVADKIYSPEVLIERTKNKNISKLNRGINKKIFNIFKESRESFFYKYNIPKNDKVLFFSGRIHELKGVILLAQVHRKLNNVGISTTTLMAGENIHGKKCQKIAGEKLKLIGYLSQSELASIYRCCDLFVFPSNFEIGPNVVLEAKACGAVCIVSPNGGGKRINLSGYDGVIVENNYTELWTTKIISLLKNMKQIIKIKGNLKKNTGISSWGEIFEYEIFPNWIKVLGNKR